MILRDKLIQVREEYLPDNSGGRTVDLDSIERIEVDCKVSVNTNPEILSQYGENNEQVLDVISFFPLVDVCKYFYENKPYTLRHITHNNRFYHSILVEIKE